MPKLSNSRYFLNACATLYFQYVYGQNFNRERNINFMAKWDEALEEQRAMRQEKTEKRQINNELRLARKATIMVRSTGSSCLIDVDSFL